MKNTLRLYANFKFSYVYEKGSPYSAGCRQWSQIKRKEIHIYWYTI